MERNFVAFRTGLFRDELADDEPDRRSLGGDCARWLGSNRPLHAPRSPGTDGSNGIRPGEWAGQSAAYANTTVEGIELWMAKKTTPADSVQE